MKWEHFAVPRTFLLPALALGATLLAGCDTTSADDGRVQIQITDAASDYISAADVWISHVYVKCGGGKDEGEHVFAAEKDGGSSHGDSLSSPGENHPDSAQGGDGEDGEKTGPCPKVDLLNDSINAFHVDLLKLHDGLVSNLTVPANLPPGKYDDLFIVVDSAKVTLKPPFKFMDGSSTAALRIAGPGRKAIKVELAQPLDVAAGQTTIVLVDFNLEDSFIFQTNPTAPAQIRNVLFVPRMLEKHRSHKD